MLTLTTFKRFLSSSAVYEINANLPTSELYFAFARQKFFCFGFERFFGFTIKEDITDIPALQPELRDQSSYYTSLVNGGIISANEARIQLGFEPLDGQDDVRVPANIAGSAVNPDEGGRPVEQEEE